VTPSKPAASRRPHGSGGLFQRCDAKAGCPPLEDGVRPEHKCHGMWVGRVDIGYNPDGTRKRRPVYGKTKAKAQARLVELQRQIASGQVAAPGSGRTTVKTWADQWLPGHIASVRPSTQATDKGAVKKWIIPTLGHKRLIDLTPRDVRALRDAVVAAGLSSTTAGTYQRILRKMLKDAHEEGHQVPANVLATKHAKKAVNDRMDIPVHQAQQILAVIAARDDAPRWMLSFLTGMRQAEILGLLVDHVDLEQGTLAVEWQLQHPGLTPTFPDGLAIKHLVATAWLTETKTAKGERTIHLGPLLLAAMTKAAQDWTPNPWGLMWVNTRGLPIRDYDDRAQWHAIQTEAGVAHPSGRAWHLHECRHTFITMLKRAGVDDSVIAQIVGQSQLVKTYEHLTGADAAPAIGGVESMLLPSKVIERETTSD
jgi:integrase